MKIMIFLVARLVEFLQFLLVKIMRVNQLFGSVLTQFGLILKVDLL